MDKVYTGIEILKMIKNSKLKENNHLIDKYNNEYLYMKDSADELVLFKIEREHKDIPDYTLFVDNEFQILEKLKGGKNDN